MPITFTTAAALLAGLGLLGIWLTRTDRRRYRPRPPITSFRQPPPLPPAPVWPFWLLLTLSVLGLLAALVVATRAQSLEPPRGGVLVPSGVASSGGTAQEDDSLSFLCRSGCVGETVLATAYGRDAQGNTQPLRVDSSGYVLVLDRMGTTATLFVCALLLYICWVLSEIRDELRKRNPHVTTTT